ncbi:MAG: DUF2914 domain-containing protein [Candidatus Accumulibacter sp.]|uniref:DUF2914 domain-containing protein n=1 Tax=Accumulibacter sp. TaxID=2053492 RepID=UPI0019F01F5E|nr:DUF2914 domain-containing protein [Accumulibacter sp.]MBE2259743.1 DUF2914 domain-containing protein [Paracoccaceae bacterium]MCB1942471.1 DUF2914 domain-containing protein [Accumulibacter sp.]MCP5250038.1 DUF2914 domain-containing protein [Accumulibacter sp.]
MKIRFLAVAMMLSAVAFAPSALASGVGSVANATFTSNVTNGAPVDFRQQFTSPAPVVYYYGELLDLAGQTVKLRWSLEGKQMREEAVKVSGARQAAWSKMKMQPQWTGDWTVEVLDGQGQVIDRRNFAYSPPL